MTEESTKLRMNLVAIQNADPYAKEILVSSPHVAFYKFQSNEWEKSEIEGSFFVYSRVAEPYHSIFINNRLNTNSLVEPITRSIELQSQPPFLLYRNQRYSISGFWFYCKDDCTRIHALLEKLIKKCNNAKPIELQQNPVIHPQQQQLQQHPVTLNQSQNNGNENKKDVDIFSMLSRAQEEFNNTSTTSTSGPPVVNNLSQQFAGMQVKNNHQPLVKNVSVNAMPDITSPNVVSFFAAAQQPNAAMISVEGQPKPFISNHPIVQPVQTLDEIEKQHRVSSSSPSQGNQNAIEPKLIKTEFNNLLSSAGNCQPPPSKQNRSILSLQPMKPQNQQTAKPTLITPAMFQPSSNLEEKIINSVSAPPSSQTSNIKPEPLTQNQLTQALLHLLENEPDFIRKVHEAYINSFNKIVSN